MAARSDAGVLLLAPLPRPPPARAVLALMPAVLRRRAGADPFVLGELAIDYEQRRVTVAGWAVPLTPLEYDLLRVLSLNAGRVMPYASLLRQVWGRGDTGTTGLVRDFVKKLRRKLGDDPANPAWILNERGGGLPDPGIPVVAASPPPKCSLSQTVLRFHHRVVVQFLSFFSRQVKWRIPL